MLCDIKASVLACVAKGIIMRWEEHYPVGRRWRHNFFRRAKSFVLVENRFIFGDYRYGFSSGVSQFTF